MTDLQAFDPGALDWQPADRLPEDRYVLTRIAHHSGAFPMRLVLGCATLDGVRLGSGDELSHGWYVDGWLEPDFEIELSSPAAAQARVKPLVWAEVTDDQAYASDGLGGHYHISRKSHGVRLDHEVDTSRRLFFDKGANPRDVAQAHNADRVRRRLE